MNHSLPVEVVYRVNNLAEDSSRFRFGHPAVSHKMIEDFSTRRIFCHQVNHLLCLHHLIQSDYVRMAQPFHYVHLSKDLCQILLVQLRLVDDFDGHLRTNRRECNKMYQVHVLTLIFLFCILNGQLQQILNCRLKLEYKHLV